MKILITGAAGFIGAQLMLTLAKRGDSVFGIDNLNNYYDVRLKYGRLQECGFNINELESDYPILTSHTYNNCRFKRLSIDDKQELEKLFNNENFEIVINLAAQAGVRYSITNPEAYIQSNIIGFFNILECCRQYPVKHLVFASSSSVYGMNQNVPYSEDDKVDTPVSLYAASKKSNELMAHSYSKLYGIPVTGLRYFTVYGPWGRPDMAPMLFTKAILADKPINIFNNGDLMRDFTYIDDIVQGTIQIIDKPIQKNSNDVAYNIYNIGCSDPIKLMDFIHELELALGKKAKKIFLPMQQGDVYQTYADTSKLEKEVGYKPITNLHKGISLFINWYLSDKNPLK